MKLYVSTKGIWQYYYAADGTTVIDCKFTNLSPGMTADYHYDSEGGRIMLGANESPNSPYDYDRIIRFKDIDFYSTNGTTWIVPPTLYTIFGVITTNIVGQSVR